MHFFMIFWALLCPCIGVLCVEMPDSIVADMIERENLHNLLLLMSLSVQWIH
jgi:hypothetical protein